MQISTNGGNSNSNSDLFINNVIRIPKLPKSLKRTTPTFDGNSKEVDLFDQLFQTSLRTNNQLKNDDKKDCFYTLMLADALQTFIDISSSTEEDVAVIKAILWRKKGEPQLMANA